MVSPTLPFNDNKGLRYAVSFNNGSEQIVNINQSAPHQDWQSWQWNRINKSVTKHRIEKPGTHTNTNILTIYNIHYCLKITMKKLRPFHENNI